MSFSSVLTAPVLAHMGHAGMSAAGGGRLPPLLFAGTTLGAVAFLFLFWLKTAMRHAGPALPLGLATLSVGAGAIHAVVVPEHLDEALIFGAFFAVVAALQLGYPLWALRRPSAATWTFGLVLNVSIVVLWLVSRTTGLPFGPHAGMPEAMGVLDGACTAGELLLAAGCLSRVWRPSLRTSGAEVTPA